MIKTKKKLKVTVNNGRVALEIVNMTGSDLMNVVLTILDSIEEQTGISSEELISELSMSLNSIRITEPIEENI